MIYESIFLHDGSNMAFAIVLGETRDYASTRDAASSIFLTPWLLWAPIGA